MQAGIDTMYGPAETIAGPLPLENVLLYVALEKVIDPHDEGLMVKLTE